jgi:hypothetical protein
MKFLLLFLAQLLQVKTGEGKVWFGWRNIMGMFSSPFLVCANCCKTNVCDITRYVKYLIIYLHSILNWPVEHYSESLLSELTVVTVQ